MLNNYYEAAFIRQKDYKHLKKNTDSMIFAIYCAGVAVECILHAYRLRNTKEYESRHDLIGLMNESKICGLISIEEREKLTVYIKRIQQTWSNDLRYYSESQMRQKVFRKITQMSYPPKNINKYLSKFESEIFKITDEILKLGKSKWT